ncbi:MAG: hypothetical protein WCG27_01970 [Pseudomonadota bacterium]
MMNTQFNPQEVSTSWIETLAMDELNMDESGVVSFEEHLNPIHFLEESSIKFVDALRDRLEFYVTKFNEYRGGHRNEAQIKTFKISNTINDFMLFRNSLRLIFNRKSNDTISIGFLTGTGELVPARINAVKSSVEEIHEIKAHVGPFNNISWRFHGEVVEIDALVRFYLTEFIYNSAR